MRNDYEVLDRFPIILDIPGKDFVWARNKKTNEVKIWDNISKTFYTDTEGKKYYLSDLEKAYEGYVPFAYIPLSHSISF